MFYFSGPRQDPPPKQVYRPPQRKTGPPEPARPEPRENRPEPPAPGKENKDVKISSEKWVPCKLLSFLVLLIKSI